MVIIKDEEIKQKIIEILKDRPGLTVENLAEEIGVHRHTLAKYLLELKGAGKIQKRKIGTAVLHYLSGQIDEKAVIGEPIVGEPLEETAVENEKEGREREFLKKSIIEKLQKLKGFIQITKSSYKRISRYVVVSLSVIGILIFIYLIRSQITGFFIAGDAFDKTSGLFITGDNSLGRNELNTYALLKSYGGNVSKIRMFDIQSADLSKYDYMVISNDASIFITDGICRLIADSNIPFIYSSRNFNNKCVDELQLSTGSLCGPNESPVWTIINNSYYQTSHVSSVPQKVKVFAEEFSIDLCAIEGNGVHSKPHILVSRDETHGYLVIFEDNLQRRVFFALPNSEFDLTEEGRTLFSRSVLWLTGK